MSKLGRCHICKERGPVTYCLACDHWFCPECAGDWYARGKAALAEKIFGRKEGCCGPDV
jgi:hypothetical protein